PSRCVTDCGTWHSRKSRAPAGLFVAAQQRAVWIARLRQKPEDVAAQVAYVETAAAADQRTDDRGARRGLQRWWHRCRRAARLGKGQRQRAAVQMELALPRLS